MRAWAGSRGRNHRSARSRRRPPARILQHTSTSRYSHRRQGHYHRAPPTEYNSPIYRGHTGSDASVVELLRKAGAIVLGKTQTVEFAWWPARHATRVNRHAPRAAHHGSAAVADFMVPLAIGTQTGGSDPTRSYCAVPAGSPTAPSARRVKLISPRLIQWLVCPFSGRHRACRLCS